MLGCSGATRVGPGGAPRSVSQLGAGVFHTPVSVERQNSDGMRPRHHREFDPARGRPTVGGMGFYYRNVTKTVLFGVRGKGARAGVRCARRPAARGREGHKRSCGSGVRNEGSGCPSDPPRGEAGPDTLPDAAGRSRHAQRSDTSRAAQTCSPSCRLGEPRLLDDLVELDPVVVDAARR